MTNCCGDYHYADCPTRTPAPDYGIGDLQDWWYDSEPMDDYDDEPFVDDDGPLWNEDAGMEAGLFGAEA